MKTSKLLLTFAILLGVGLIFSGCADDGSAGAGGTSTNFGASNFGSGGTGTGGGGTSTLGGSAGHLVTDFEIRTQTFLLYPGQAMSAVTK